MRTNNSNNSNNSSSGGIGFTGLLTVAFVVLKLCGVIAWSWWWVLSPIWITILLIIAIVVLAVIVKLFCE
jgi:membrane protein YdbS with pleckstrin-like domain